MSKNFEVATTVITPVHNSGRWLDETILSVRRQTEENFRYLIIDDSSTDDSREIALDHAAADDRLKVLSVTFGSVACTRQFGVDMVDTPFVSFLDGDDRWRPTFLEKLSETFASLDDGVLATYGMMGIIDEHSRSLDAPEDATKGSPHISAAGRIDFDNYLLCDTPARTASSLMVRTPALYGQRFRQEAEPCEDYDLWMHVLDAHPGAAFYGIKDQLFDYRIRADQLTSDASRLFTKLDRLYATFVPRMRNPADRWEVYQNAVTGAQVRGCLQFAPHFSEMAKRLADDPDFKPYLLGEVA